MLKLSKGKKFKINGVYIELFPISELANALGRTTQTVRKWEANGVIPKAIFRDKSKKRLYSREQIELIVKVAEEENIRQGEALERTNFSKRIFAKWKDVTQESLKKGVKK